MAAADNEAQLLGVDVGFPLLSVREVLYDSTGRRIEIGHIVYRSDRYRFQALVLATPTTELVKEQPQ